MLSRKQFRTIVVAALVAGALARSETELKSGHDVVTPEEPIFQPDNNSVVAVVSVDVNNVVPESVSVQPQVQEIQRFQDMSKAVNQRFPHAVQFGGVCGGSIISPEWVLTAAHCSIFTQGRIILAGTNNSEDGSGVTRRVKKLYIHPLFTAGPYWLDPEQYDLKQVAARWDYMLAELSEPLELDGVNIDKVELDDQTESVPDTLVGYAGYGTDYHGGAMRTEMHGMDLQIQSNEVCGVLEQYNSEDMLCARGYAPKFDAACSGDSGSGLVGNGRLMGIASWVQNDAFECRNGNMVVFSRVGRVRDWIRQVTGV